MRVSFLNALFVLASASTRRFGFPMLCFPGAGVGCPLLSSRALWRSLRLLPCSSVCGLHCTGPTNARQLQWETVISCAGCQVFLVRLGGASSAMRAVHVAAGYSMKEGSSISGSGCLGHGGAGFRSRNGLFCVPSTWCTRAVAQSLLCEELAVILVDGCVCGARAHPCEATT